MGEPTAEQARPELQDGTIDLTTASTAPQGPPDPTAEPSTTASTPGLDTDRPPAGASPTGATADAAALPPTTSRMPRVFREPMWVLGFVILIDEIDKNIIRGMITPIKEEFGVGDFGISILLSMALLVNGLITVPAGYLADRWHRTRAIGKTVVGWSAITALGAAAWNFPALVALRSALGFGQAITEPSAASLLGDHYPPEERGKAFSIQQVMLLAGTGIGVALGGFLSHVFNWRVGLLIAALPGLLIAWLTFRMREPKRGSADMMAAIGAGTIEHADEDVQLIEGSFWQFCKDMASGLRADLKTIMAIRTMRYALTGVAGLLFTVTAIASWLPQYYERHLYFGHGKGEAAFGLLAILGGVPGVLVGGKVADKYATKVRGGRLALPAVFLFVGALLFSTSYLLRMPAGSTDLNWMVAGPVFAIQLLGLFIVTMAIPGLRAGLTDAVPAHLRGAGFGAFNLVSVVFGMAAAPFIVGAISAAYDENLRVAFLAVTPISLVGAAVLFQARKFLDEDMNKIMMAVLVALQDERDRQADKA